MSKVHKPDLFVKGSVLNATRASTDLGRFSTGNKADNASRTASLIGKKPQSGKGLSRHRFG